MCSTKWRAGSSSPAICPHLGLPQKGYSTGASANRLCKRSSCTSPRICFTRLSGDVFVLWLEASTRETGCTSAPSPGLLGAQESWCLFPVSRYRVSTAAAKSSTFACERSWPSATRTRASGKLYFALVKIDYDGNVPDSAWGSSSQVHEVCRLDFFHNLLGF